jgi:hypothetical protein
MSHYALMIIGEEPEEQLKPFDENIEVKRIKTKEEHIASSKKDIEWYNEYYYKKYLKNKEKYIEEAKRNPGHIKYITVEFSKKLDWTDEEHYQNSIRYYEKENINDDGSTNETYNPDSKWDWYQIGGRWTGSLYLKKNQITGVKGKRSLLDKRIGEPRNYDQARLKDIDFEQEEMKDFVTFAVLKDGKWYERGKMGWWGCVSNEKPEDEWDKEFKKLLYSLEPEDLITIVDCHI